MSELSATQIQRPSDEQAFERCNEVLWRCILKDETVKTYSRRGKDQYGVDLTGFRDGAPDALVGVQCKLKEAGKKLSKSDVRKEVVKALTFEPLLSEYIIVTTAPDDGELDSLAHELSIDVSKDRAKPINIKVFGWGSLEREIRRYPRALKAFDPSHTPHGDLLAAKLDALPNDVAAAIAPQFAALASDLVAHLSLHRVDPAIIGERVNSALEAQINDYADLIATEPQTALRLFTKLAANLDSEANNRVRFRVAANIASCQLELGDEEIGAQGLIAAYELDQENPKAVANKALGLLLLGDHETLRGFCEEHSATMHANAALACYYVQGLIADDTIENPLERVPEGLRNTVEVAQAHVRWLMERGAPGAWREAAITAYGQFNKVIALEEIYANALIDRVIANEGFRYGRTISTAERADIETVVSIYERRWNDIKDGTRHVRGEPISIPLNLILAYRLLHEGDKAVAVSEEALKRFPENQEVMERATAAFLEFGENVRAAAIAPKLTIRRETVMVRFNYAMAANDWKAAIDIVDSHIDLMPAEERGLAIAAKAISETALASQADRDAILECAQHGLQGDARALAILAQSARVHQLEERAGACFAEAQEAYRQGDDGFAARMMIAQESMARAEPKIAADVLIDYVDIDRDSPELRLLARALAYDFPIRSRAVRFFERLAPDIRDKAVFQSLEGAFHVNRGAPKDAVKPFARAFELSPSMGALMALVGAHLRLGDRNAIRLLLDRDGVDALPGAALLKIHFCQVLSDFDEHARALSLGYEALIEGLDQAEVVMKFFGLIIMPPAPKPQDFVNVVAPGAWVRFNREKGDPFEGIIDEAADRPWGARIAAGNAFIAKAAGLKAGENFQSVSTFGVEERWTVAEIKPRWLQAFHCLSKEFNQRFPDAQGFAMLHMEEGDVAPALEQVRRYSAAQQAKADLYLVNRFPLAFVAHADMGGAIAFADYLIGRGKPLRACVGAHEEREDALRKIAANKKAGAVIDALTAWHAAALGVLPALEKTLGPIAIPATELARIKRAIETKLDAGEGEQLSMSYENGQFFRTITTKEERAKNLETMNSLLAAIETACAVEPVVIPDQLSEIGEALLEFGSGDAVAPALLAGASRLLLCEDMMMRQVAKTAYGVEGIWIQAALFSALSEGNIDIEGYSDALVFLAAWCHEFVSISPPALLSVYERDDAPELVRFEILSRCLGSRDAEAVSHLSIASAFINAVWRNASLFDLKPRKATSAVLRAILARDRGGDWAQWASILYLDLAPEAREYFVNWCRGHFLPVEEIGAVLQQTYKRQQR